MNVKTLRLSAWLCAGLLLAGACSRSPTASITLHWAAPTQNEDGSALDDLAGYRVYWGQDPGGPYEHSADIGDPAETSHVVKEIPDGTWYFVMTAVNADQAESTLSNEVSIEIENGAPVPQATHTSLVR